MLMGRKTLGLGMLQLRKVSDLREMLSYRRCDSLTLCVITITAAAIVENTV